jgi:WD40 repeat protein
VRIWHPPTPQDYSTARASAAFAGTQVHLQYTARALQRKRLTRRRVLIGIGAASAAALALGIGVNVWQNTQTSQSIYTLTGPNGPVYSVAWSLDSRHVAAGTASDNAVYVWDLKHHNNAPPNISSSFDGLVTSVAYTFADTYAAGSMDSTIEVVSIDDQTTFRRQTDGPVQGLSWSPDGTHLVVASSTSIHVWDIAAQTSTILQTADEDYNGVAWSPDGAHIAAACGVYGVEIWNTSNLSSYGTYSGLPGAATCVAWSPDSLQIAVCGLSPTVSIWNIETRTVITTYSINNDTINVYGLAWSPDGQYIASASDDNVVRVWSARTAETVNVYAGHRAPVRTVAWSLDGRYIASAGDDNTVQIWAAP